MRLVNSPHAPGVVGLTCGELARYTQFHACFNAVQAPPGAHEEYGVGYSTAMNSNDLIRKMHPTDEWVWIMDDDHAFPSHLLIELLNRQVDLVVPLYLQRKSPFWPVAYREEPTTGRFAHVPLSELAGQTGLLKVDSAGKGGLLIRRPVLIAMAGADCVCPPPEPGEPREHQPDCVWPRTPWFEQRGMFGEDHAFFSKARELGFQPHVDLDQPMDHLTTIAVAPKYVEGQWLTELNLQNSVRVLVQEVPAA